MIALAHGWVSSPGCGRYDVYAFGGSGGCGGGYGGGVLTVVAGQIAYDVQNPPRFLVAGQQGGVGLASWNNGADGEGGMLVIECPGYTPASNHCDLGTTTFGAHTTPSSNGGHGIVRGRPQQVFINGLAYGAPVIVANPASTSAIVGENVSLSVDVVGTAPLNYQWQLNGTNLSNGGRISGATSSVLSIANVQPSDAGNYTVSVANFLGSVSSTPALLLVVQSNATATLWTNNIVLRSRGPYPFAGIYEFDNLVLNDNVEVTTEGISHLVLKVRGTLLLGSNTVIRVRNGYYPDVPQVPISTLTASDLASLGSDAGGFRVYPRMFGRGGNGGDGESGETHSYAWGGNYVWYGAGGGGGGGGGFGGGQAGAGADNDPHAGQSNGGGGGHGGQGLAIIGIDPTPGICPGSAGGIGGGATGLGGNGYSATQFSDGTVGGGGGGGGNGGGVGSVTRYFDALGLYNIRGGYGGGGGGYGGGTLTIIADTILFDLRNPPCFLVSGQRGGRTVDYNNVLLGNPGSNGEGGLLVVYSPRYLAATNHWCLGSRTSGSLAAGGNGGHGVVTGDPQAVFVLPYVPGATAPSILSAPQSQTARIGDNVAFAVVASGVPPLSYQWQRNGNDLPGATNATLLITNVQSAHAGDYVVVVANSSGSVTTAPPAHLTVVALWSENPTLIPGAGFQFVIHGQPNSVCEVW
ncbi:MAG: immunoglobulin domain-containing protein, partial [Verrucomicrobia bacterium]|nr:immunoglobulin domain-containing protein [Verrucomicrobiota bacterium]